MAKKAALPDYKTKQAILYNKNARPQELEAMGKLLLQAGWLYDAIDFFQRAKTNEGLKLVREMALHDGDIFLLRRVLHATGEEGSPELWQQVGEVAQQLGKLEFALEAFRLSGDRKSMDKIYEILRPPPSATQAPAEAEKDREAS